MTTPLQLIALAGINQNTALRVSASLTNALSSWNSQTWVADWKAAVLEGATPVPSPTPPFANVTLLSNATLGNMTTIGSSTCPALGEAFPVSVTGVSANYLTPGVTGLIASQAVTTMSTNDLSKFCQAFSSATGYVAGTNQTINVSINSGSFLGPTFTGMDSLTTGDITKMNQALPEFAGDLRKLGFVINLANLGDMGSPAALLQNLFARGVLPTVSNALVAEGIPLADVNALVDPDYELADSSQRLAYLAMTKIVGNDLEQVLAVLQCTTANIKTMADLLNPVKLFPNSFRTMTTTTNVGVRGIYLDSNGTVNSNLERQLPQYYIREIPA
jgi:hypothetical protein